MILELRPVDLKAGDVLTDTGETVTAKGFPCRDRGSHWYRVETSNGFRQWPLEDAARFATLEVEREETS